jgi:tetratricopeptide (TPR) repeat protein
MQQGMKDAIAMDERDYVSRLKGLWPSGDSDRSLADVLALSEHAVRDYPRSVSLLCMRGDLLQLAPSTYQPHDDPKSCYLRAIEIDPRCSEAWESLGFYFDVFDEDYTQAIEAFRQAIESGAGPDSVRGLAAALAESGQRCEGLTIIERALQGDLSDADRSTFSELREEIERGDYDRGVPGEFGGHP